MDLKDYKEYIASAPMEPPHALSQQVLTVVRNELAPDATKLFLKLFSIHALTALFTLSICPQLGFRLLGDGPGLMGYFMALGNLGCMSACGFFFLASSVGVATLVLRAEEIRVIRAHRWAEIGSLSILSLGVLFALNPGVLLSVALLWLAGAMAGAFFALEAGWRARVVAWKT